MREQLLCTRSLVAATFLGILLCLASGPFTFAAPDDRSADGLWTEVRPMGLVGHTGSHELPEVYTAFELDIATMRETLQTAPAEFTTTEPVTVVELPMPDGEYRSFVVQETEMMEAELQAKYRVQTYRIQSVDDPTVIGRIVVRADRFSATIRSDAQMAKIRRFNVDGAFRYVSHWEEDAPDATIGYCGQPAPASSDLDLGISSKKPPEDHLAPKAYTDPVLMRPYRLAFATTPRFTAAIGSTEDVLDVVTDLHSAINLIYEDDFAIWLVLVAETDQLFFNDSDNPPPSSCGSFDDWLNPCYLKAPNQCAIDEVLGSANYDVGHLLARYMSSSNPSGCATYPDHGACTSTKAHGVSAHWQPANPWVYITAHELGHQFGAQHTLSSNQANCNGAFVSAAACEPGSGSTIMAYPGHCPWGEQGDNVQDHADLYFHSCSLDEVYAEVDDTADCYGTPIPTGNTPPTVEDLPSMYDIPKSTPFTLTGLATDPDMGIYTILYSWDQVDKAPTQSSPYQDDGEGDPIFRSGPLSTNPTRVFEDLDLPGYILPTTERSIAMRLVARDTQGGVDYEETALKVSGSAFMPLVREGETVGSMCGARWTAGATAGFGVEDVDVFFSTDGGETFPEVPTTTISVTDQKIDLSDADCPTESAAIRIEPVDTETDFIFFAESPAFSIECTDDCPTTTTCGTGCRTTTFPTLCPVYPTGTVSCDAGQSGIACCDANEELYVKVCQCEAIFPGTLCLAEQRSLVCRESSGFKGE